MRKYTLIGVLLGASWAWGQPLTTPVNVTPDCMIFFDFTDNASSASFDNRFIGCKTWYVAYTNTGFPALTLTFQSAPDNGGVPGAWVAFAGTVIEGVNPNVALTQASTIMYGYYPWQRITLTGAVAGAGRRLRGTFYGYRQVPVATVIVAPGVVSDVNLLQVGGVAVVTGGVAGSQGVGGLAADGAAVAGNPVRVAGVDNAGNTQNLVAATTGVLATSGGLAAAADGETNTQLGGPVNEIGQLARLGTYPYAFNGATWDRDFSCDERAVVTLAGIGNTEIIALGAGEQIRVCHVSIAFVAPVDFSLTEGTGANCAVGTANVTGVYQAINYIALDFNRGYIRGTAGNALCVNLGAGVAGGGVIIYERY